MSFVFLPNPNLRFVQGDGVLSIEAYRALKGLQTNLQDQIDTLAEIVAQIVALNADVTELENSKADKDLLVTGSGSVQRIGGNDLSTPVIFQLVNDQSYPAPNLTYGTDGAGTKGWMPFGSANVAYLPGATYTSLQQFVNTMHSPGTISGGEISDLGSGNIRVAAGTGMIRVADDDASLLPFFDFDQTDFVVPADQLTRFFGVVYNGGSPIVEMRTVFDWDKDTEIPLGSCVRFNGTTVVLTNPYRTGDPITNIIQRFDAIGPAQRDNSVGGLLLGEVATRTVTLSAGVIWSRLIDHAVAAKNSSVDGMISGFFNGTGLTLATGVTQWDNAQYNDTGAGTLVALGNNKYANLWFFVTTEGDQYGFIYGTDEYNTLAEASTEGVPFFLTGNFFAQTLLVGRFIFQEGAASASVVESAFTRVFTTQPVSNHNDLSGLQGGTTNEYYHFNATQHPKLVQIGNLVDPNADRGLFWDDSAGSYAYFSTGTGVGFNGTVLELNTTLTALAGTSWAANAFPIGSGAGTVAQVAFAANTFPARASTGNLVAKAITDGSLGVLAGTSGTTTFLRGDGTASATLTGPITATAANVNSGADTVTNGGVLVTGVTSGSAMYGAASTGRGIIECSQTGNTNLDIDPKPLDGTGIANFRFFRTTNTTGIARFQVFIGSNSGTMNASIAGKGDDTFFCADNGNFALFGIGSFGSGTKVTFIGNSTVVPTTNPTGGGVLYSESGSLKWRESGGTITTMASSGTYAATATAVTNVTATSPSADFMYIRTGSFVHVSGTLSITPTAPGGAVVRITLPVASNFSATTQASGVMVGTNGAVREVGHVSADTTNDQLSLNFAPTLATAYTVRFEATYQII